MPARTWIWLGLIVALVAVGMLLAWVDSLILERWIGEYLHLQVPRKVSEMPRLRLRRLGFGPVGKLGYQPFSFTWFLSLGFVLSLVSLAVSAVFPVRVRVAVERLESGGGPVVATVAGLVTVVLVAALAFTLRHNLVLFGLVPLLSLVAAVLAAFGLACIGFAAGRRLRRLLGPANAFVCALAGTLLVYDLILVPVAGWVLAALVLLAALGLAVVTRMGSEVAWNFEELDW
jgi:hypothetical protein